MRAKSSAKANAIFPQHLRAVALGVDGDGNEGDLATEIGAEPVLDEGHHRGEDRTGIGAFGEDEGHRDHLAAEICELHQRTVLRNQCKIRRWRDLGELLAWGILPAVAHSAKSASVPSTATAVERMLSSSVLASAR
jgi:hypothetical protein